MCIYTYIYIYIYRERERERQRELYKPHHKVETWSDNCGSRKTRRIVSQTTACDGHVMFTLLDLCVSSLRRGHANLLCVVPIFTDDPRRKSHNPIRCITQYSRVAEGKFEITFKSLNTWKLTLNSWKYRKLQGLRNGHIKGGREGHQSFIVVCMFHFIVYYLISCSCLVTVVLW